ncbi:uncharacterized protein HD556DRAFT_1302835 [Suillus plorans]|uniref:Uncharacterized protein n=1 Tax=Suillus plorans TaxID=116603 RepID=A0A9P7DYK2_9AGAM|nr:uncharacterized protein HD556DRAFT_1302835 [Suillus plorans]KAG1806329.1 hypothetical protein HD556DRAFT_1302835 [Suillus plorans]
MSGPMFLFRNVRNVRDSEWWVSVSVFGVFSDKKRMIFAEFNKELQISNDLLLLRGRKVNNGDRYNRTGHREDKCAGKYQVQCVGNVSIGLVDKHWIERVISVLR